LASFGPLGGVGHSVVVYVITLIVYLFRLEHVPRIQHILMVFLEVYTSRMCLVA
jgi:hypothetical protein